MVRQPGSALFENALAEEAGVSRTPVRDALKRLAREGLVDITAGQGSFVAMIDTDRLNEVVTLRALLETEAASRAAQLADRSRLGVALKNILARQRLALRASSYDEVYAIDELFHHAIFEAADLPLMWANVRVARAAMDRIHHTAAARAARPRQSIAAHAAIAAAIAAGDPAAAASAMRAHIDSNLVYLTELAGSYPHFLKTRR